MLHIIMLTPTQGRGEHATHRVYMLDKDHLQNPRPINRDGVIEIFRMTL